MFKTKEELINKGMKFCDATFNVYLFTKFFIDADYSQIELRVLAHLSKDSVMIDSFKNDLDIHYKTASEVL